MRSQSSALKELKYFVLVFQELEVIEENWQSEVKELLGVVSKLTDDNKRLKDTLHNEQRAVEEQVSAKYRGTATFFFLICICNIFVTCLPVKFRLLSPRESTAVTEVTSSMIYPG
jgi:hypothetical protein